MRWIALFVVLVAVAGCAQGSAIVTGTSRPPISVEFVVVYLDPPPSYEKVGIVEATSVVGATLQQDTDMAIAELKKQAAKIGANGVLLIQTGSTVGTSSGVYYGTGGYGGWTGGYANTASVRGIAIRVSY